MISKEIEPRHDKTNKLSVRPAKTQISLDAQADLTVRPAKTQISLDAKADLRVRWAHTHSVGFVLSWLIYGI